MRLSTIFKSVAIFVFVGVVTICAILYNTGVDRYKSEISTLVEALTDRRLTIKGEFKVSFGMTPALAVDQLTFSNAKWGSRRDMARIKSLRAELELLPLLYGEIRIKRIVLTGADILLETRADGLGNWVLQPQSKSTEGLPILPTFDRVLIKSSVLVWRDRRTGTKSTVKIRRMRTSAASATTPLKLNLRGTYNGQALRLTGQVDSLASLTSNKPTTVQLKLKSGDAWLKAHGKIREPISGANLKVAITGAGKNLATLSRLFGTELPAIGPYKYSANVVNDRSRWRFRQSKIKVGRSDFRGYVSINPSTTPINIYAKLRSKLFRTADFEERTTKKKSKRSKRKKSAARRSKKTTAAERFFSSDKISISGLEDLSVKLLLKAERVKIDDVALKKASVTVAISKGRLTLQPATAKFEGGNLKVYLALSPVVRGMRFKFRADVKNLDVARLSKRLGHTGLATGRIFANTSLNGSGSSMRSIMAGLNGHFITMMKRGNINNKKFTRLSGETLAAILPWSSGDKGIQVKCLVGQYAIKKGRLSSNVTLLDTDRLLVKGEGGVNLASEIIQFTITPKAKEASFVNLLVPIKIEGNLSDPEIYADPAGVAKNALGFATGGILANGLVSEIIGSIVSGLSGEKKANPCLAAISEIRSSVSKKGNKKTKRKSQTQSPKGGDNVFDSIGEGLKNLFSR